MNWYTSKLLESFLVENTLGVELFIRGVSKSKDGIPYTFHNFRPLLNLVFYVLMEILSIVSWVTFVVSCNTDQDKFVANELLSFEFFHVNYLLLGAYNISFFS